MQPVTQTITSVISGALLGIALLFLAIAASVSIGFATNGKAFIPGVFEAWFTTENDMPALNFIPNGIGMSAFIVLTAIAYTAAMHRRAIGKRRSLPE